MEPKLKKKSLINRIFKRQFIVSIMTIFLLIFILIGSSYALFNVKTETGLTDVVVRSGNLLATISSDSEMIEMNYATLGVSDEIGLTYNPYTFTVTNNGENEILYYEIRIVDKEYEISTLPHKSLNYVISKNNDEYTSIQNLGDNRSYIYVGGSLDSGESDTFKLKLWVNEEYGEYANNKVLKASIELTLYSEIPTRNYIIYDTQGGSYIPKTSVVTKRVTNQIPIKKGYDFLGWSGNSNGNIEYEQNAIYDRKTGITLYAVWKEKKLYDVIISNALLDNTKSEYVSSETGIDFSQISSNTNGRGLYMMSDTKDEEYPIMYYRGNVDNNNVMFGGYCWKMVRTTETGGIKLIYNGEPIDTYKKTILAEEQYSVVNNNGFTYDESSGYWKTESDSTNGLELSFNVPKGNYVIDLMGYVAKGSNLTGTYKITNDGVSVLSETLSYGGLVTTNKETYDVTASNVITIKLTDSGWSLFNVRLIKKENFIGIGCDNIGESTIIKNSSFNKKTNALSFNGYMYNKVYEYTDEYPVANAYFGSDVIYSNGVYQLLNAGIGYNMSSRHYTCNNLDSTATCETIKYYISDGRYIELTNGKKIIDIVSEMISNSDINQIDSQAKLELESWYSDNLLKYGNNVEDAVWCNDREINDYGIFTTPSKVNYLYYDGYSRSLGSKIKLNCSNEVDSFSTKSPLAILKYPIGLLTADEIRLAGAKFDVVNMNYYLYTKCSYWTMTPAYFHTTVNGARALYIVAIGDLDYNFVSAEYGLRPSISLIHDISYIKGDGTKGSPYVIR